MKDRTQPFSPEFVERLNQAKADDYEIENLRYECVRGWGCQAICDVTFRGSMRAETKIGPHPNLEALQNRLIQFFQ